MNTSYHKWLNFLDPQFQYFLYIPEKLFFGKKLKERLKRKWHHRYIRTRNKKYKQQGIPSNRVYFGRIVYTYYFHQSGDNKLAFTCNPRCKHSKPFPLNYAEEEMRGFYET